MSSTFPQVPVRSLSVQRALGSCSTLLIALQAFACSERYSLGEVAEPDEEARTGTPQTPEELPVDAQGQVTTLLIDGPEDGDVATEYPVSYALGDVDGDGHDDWMWGRYLGTVNRSLIVYGAPRSPDGVLQLSEGAGINPFPGEVGVGFQVQPVGDLDGDGAEELALGGSLSARSEPGQPVRFPLDSPELWLSQRTLLMYGGERRPGQDLVANAAALSVPDLAFPQEWADRVRARGEGIDALRNLSARGLGDLDGDGLDDLALLVDSRFASEIVTASPWNDSSWQQTISSETSADAYIYYGSSEHLATDPSRNVAAARIPGASGLMALGDVDGDGSIELAFKRDELLQIVNGGTARLSGNALQDRAPSLVAVSYAAISYVGISALGDLDGDGYADFSVQAEAVPGNGETSLFLYYGGPDRLARAIEVADADATFQLNATDDRGSLEVLPVGDWDGDGSTDLLLVEHTPMAGTSVGQSRGRVLLGGAARFSGIYALPPEPKDTDGKVAYSFHPLGDVDGDGFADIAFSAGINNEGGSFIKYGGPLSPVIY